MKYHRIAKILIVCAFFSVVVTPHQSEAEEFPAFIPGQVIVKVDHEVIDRSDNQILFTTVALNTISQQYGLLSIQPVFLSPQAGDEIAQTFGQRMRRAGSSEVLVENDARRVPDVTNLFLLQFPDDVDVERIAQGYQNETHIIFAEPNYTIFCNMVLDDPHHADQWAFEKIEIPQAWDISTGISSSIIAVLDSGIDTEHPDITARIRHDEKEIINSTDDGKNGFVDGRYGFNFLKHTIDIQDDNGHGTAVAGIIGAEALNNHGIAGIDWHAAIMPVKVISAEGIGDSVSLSRGLWYAVTHGVDIINISVSTHQTHSNIISELINCATTFGCVVIVAARGDNEGNFYYPAGDSRVITVGASDENDHAVELTYGKMNIDIAAPGVDIISLRSANTDMPAATLIDDYYLKVSGTSFAAAFVSGVASLMLAVNSALSITEIKMLMQQTTDVLSLEEGKASYGRLNAYRALVAARTKKEQDYYAYTQLLDTLIDSDWEEQKEAANALVSYGSDVVALILAMLQDSSINLSVGQKGLLIHTLGRIGSAEAVPYLMAAYQPEENSYLRRNIIEALGRIGHADAQAVLIEALSDVNAGVRARAVHALSAVADESAGAMVRARLSDTDEQVRSAAVDTLVEIGDSASVTTLLDGINAEEVNQDFKNELVSAVGELGDAQALNQLYKYRDELSEREPEEKIVHFQWQQSLEAVDNAIKKIETRSHPEE